MQRLLPDRPSETKFGAYLRTKEIPVARAARELGITRAYVHMLRTGQQTPSLKTAAAIKKWSGGEVTFESWLRWI